MTQRVNELSIYSAKLGVCLDLYDELKRKKVSTHEEYLVTRTKLIFLQKEILSICDSMSAITGRKENTVKNDI